MELEKAAMGAVYMGGWAEPGQLISAPLYRTDEKDMRDIHFT